MSIALPNRSDRGPAHRPWIELYPTGIPATLQYPSKPLWWLLERAAAKCPRRVACHYYDQRLTYDELFNEARRAAAVFQWLGVQPGDRVGLLLPNTPDYLIAAYGAWMAGGVVVSINPLSAPQEVSALVKTTGCRIIVGLDLLISLVAGCRDQLDHVLVTTIANHLSITKRLGYSLVRWRRNRGSNAAVKNIGFRDELAKRRTCSKLHTASGDEPAYILPTGGTTGDPKAVVLTHDNLMANAWQLMHWTGQSFGQESLLSIVPFFHSYGLSTCAMTGVAAAATMIMHHRFDPPTVVGLIERHRPTCFPAVPMMLNVLNASFRQRRRRADKPLVRYCISGGAPMDVRLAREFAEHTGAVVVEGYGLSEASPVTHVSPLDGTAVEGTIGVPLPDTEARIVDQETGQRNLGRGVCGELLVRGPQVMAGYYRNPRATSQTIRDGWLYTGDLAEHGHDGMFRIVDRKKDLIITSGANVYPAEVEEVLRRCPGVLDAAVIGVPNSQRGELVKAVIAVEHKSRFRRKAFDTYCETHLAKYKRPKILEIIDDDLPRNFLGKVVRRKLRS